jgi:hypothetical protein
VTRDQAQQHCEARNAEGGAGRWIAREIAPGDWRAVKVTVPGLTSAPPEGTRTEERPRPDYADDPRPALFRNVPPYGGGI